jgi:hypothetical protein
MKSKAFDFLQLRPPKISTAQQAMGVLKEIAASSFRFARPGPGAGRMLPGAGRLYALRNT